MFWDKKDNAKAILSALGQRLGQLDPFVKEHIEAVFKELAKEMNLKLGEVIHPCRLAISGRTETPPMYDVVELLGKEQVSARIQSALAYL